MDSALLRQIIVENPGLYDLGDRLAKSLPAARTAVMAAMSAQLSKYPTISTSALDRLRLLDAEITKQMASIPRNVGSRGPLETATRRLDPDTAKEDYDEVVARLRDEEEADLLKCQSEAEMVAVHSRFRRLRDDASVELVKAALSRRGHIFGR